MSPRYAVGIDLGTTNCTLAGVPLDDEKAGPESLGVAQVVHPSEVARPPRLPSFLYLPAAGELAEGALSLPWQEDLGYAVGEHARNRGAEVPGRVVASAKSWLSHDGVDRKAAILPAGAPDDVEKLSPVDASARYLEHLKNAWDETHPDAPLAEQDVIVTVPASFDAVARGLTEDAAHQAGLGRLTLLEEPQAALYAFLADHAAQWRNQLEVGDVILVVDLGGGTTDFSLILVGEEEGNLSLDRLAVGEHILLGGDNMDLALAWRVKMRLEEEGKKIDDWQLRGLTHSCRTAKEELLEDPSLTERTVVVPGRGRKLIGGSLSATLTRQEVDETLLQGFFPEVDYKARPQTARTSALTTLGLPYAADAAITKHLAAFLGGPGLLGAVSAGLDPSAGWARPTAVLFNGGVTKGTALRDRVVTILDGWLEGTGAARAKILEGADPDAAVSRGAAYYGRARQGRGVRIKGGTQRAYYVGIEKAELAVPGIPPRLDAVCIAPFGMEEGSEIELPMELGLVVGQSASFRFFSSTVRREDEVAAVTQPGEDLEEMPPIETTIEAEDGAGDGEAESAAGQVVPVKLHSRITEVGTLELSAVEVPSGRRHKLEFDVRVG